MVGRLSLIGGAQNLKLSWRDGAVRSLVLEIARSVVGQTGLDALTCVKLDPVKPANFWWKYRDETTQDTTQVRPCPLLAGSCKQAAWWTGDWSNCSLPTGMTCGEGVRTRAVSCSRAGVQSLPLADCLLGGAPAPEQSQMCHVDCSDSTCQLSTWSAWSECGHHHCGHSRQRQRSPISGDNCTGTHLDTVQDETCPCDQYSAKPVGQCTMNFYLGPAIRLIFFAYFLIFLLPKTYLETRDDEVSENWHFYGSICDQFFSTQLYVKWSKIAKISKFKLQSLKLNNSKTSESF